MVLSARRWFRRALFVMLMVLCTSIVYDGCQWLAAWLTPADPYRVPQGQALKVSGMTVGTADDATFAERLRLFYWYGE